MTITLAAVYAPIGFLSGLTGVLFKEFAFTLAIAVIVSGFVAVTLSPIMSAYTAPSGGEESAYARFVGRVLRQACRAATAASSTSCCICAARSSAFGVFVCVLAVPLYMFSGQELAPVEDEGFIFMIINSAPDASLAYTSGNMDKVLQSRTERCRSSRPCSRSCSRRTASAATFSRTGTTASAAAHEIHPEVFGGVSQIKELQIYPAAARRRCRAPATTTSRWCSRAPARRSRWRTTPDSWSARPSAAASSCSPTPTSRSTCRRCASTINRERVADLGLDLADVGRQLGILLAGNYVNRFTLDGRAYKVIPQVGVDARASRRTPARLQDPHARRQRRCRSRPSPRLETFTAPRTLARFQQTDSFRVLRRRQARRDQGRGAGRSRRAAAKTILPSGYTIDYAGESRQLRQEGTTLAGTLGFAVLLIYLVLVAQFGSFRDPLGRAARLGAAGALGGARVHLLRLHDDQHLQPDRPHHAGRPHRQERHSHRRFANELQVQGHDKLTADPRGRRHPPAPHPDDHGGDRLRPPAAGLRDGRRREARNSIGIMLVTGMAIGTAVHALHPAGDLHGARLNAQPRRVGGRTRVRTSRTGSCDLAALVERFDQPQAGQYGDG